MVLEGLLETLKTCNQSEIENLVLRKLKIFIQFCNLPKSFNRKNILHYVSGPRHRV